MKRSLLATVAGIIIFAILIGFMVGWMWFVVTIRIHTTSGVNVITNWGISINDTITNTTTLNEISAQTAPTVVNGIIASTSVIIGFMATFSGIFLTNISKDDRKTVAFIITVLANIPLIVIFLFFSLLNIAGGEVFFGLAIKLAWMAFLLALFMIVSIFIVATYVIHERERLSGSKKEELTQTPLSHKITLKCNGCELEVTGMNSEEIDKVLRSWKDNINVAENKLSNNPSVAPETNGDKTLGCPYPSKLQGGAQAQSNNFKIGLKGTIKPRNILGIVVGSEIEVSWEITNLDSRPFPGDTLYIIMKPPNDQFVQFKYPVKPLQPDEKTIINKNEEGNPLTTNVLAPGFTLFSAHIANVDIYSPPNQYRHPATSFLSMLGKSKEELYSLYGLLIASSGLLITSIIGLIQLFLNST
ncbi:MAG: hypothetical protein NWE93_09300 [Candidatus Bathyarchaeota archaeon]|nr:hypothetical protein [Candidatus Bathyarchaeota archaeon]